jgi:hypothetical protein
MCNLVQLWNGKWETTQTKPIDHHELSHGEEQKGVARTIPERKI